MKYDPLAGVLQVGQDVVRALPRRDFEALLGPAKALLAAGASSYGRVGG